MFRHSRFMRTPCALVEVTAQVGKSQITDRKFFATSACFVALLAAEFLALTNENARADALVACGNDTDGELGNGIAGQLLQFNAFIPVSDLSSGVTSIAVGNEHSLAVQNGAVYAMGRNNSGQLGDGSTTAHYTPTLVPGLTSNVTAVAAGSEYSFAIQNGALYAWGFNSSGGLGDGSTTWRYAPVPVTGLTSGVTAIAAGGGQTLAVQNGALYTWGNNEWGKLGIGGFQRGSDRYRSTPVKNATLTSGVTDVAAGVDHSMALMNGGVYTWGYNYSGQLGYYPTSLYNSTPLLVSNLASGVTDIAAGWLHSLAVKNGAVYAWGDDSAGQLGDGGNALNPYTPVQVDPTDLSNIVAVAAGITSSYALAADGSLWVWGSNGALGLGTDTPGYKTPQHLLPPTGYIFTSITGSSGGGHVLATLAPVPEPTSFALLALGGTMVMRQLRQRSKHV